MAEDIPETSLDEYEAFLAESQEPPAAPLATDTELVDTMGKYAELRQRKQDLEQELKDINAVLKTQNEVILATFDARSIQKMHIKNVGLFYRQESPHPAVVNKEEFIKWLDGHGEGEIAVRTVNFQTLRKWWKEQMEHGAPLPPEELAKAFIDRSIRVRKG